MNISGKQLFEKIKYCSRCCMPETLEGVVFDELGICRMCQAAEEKIHINWTERVKKLEEILESAKKNAGDNYDCIVPISGGKDSTFQLHVLVKVYGMKPLAVTFSHNWYSKTGWYNLQNALEQFNVDHVMFTPNRDLVNRIARRSLETIGDTCWACHAGVGAFPIQIAVKYKIPLMVWGESISDSSGRATYFNPLKKFDRDYFTTISARLYPEQMVCDYLSLRDLKPFMLPSYEEYAEADITGIHLGDFMFWDDERQTEFVRDTYGWMETEMEGTYKGYKSAECMMAGMHDFTCYLKRGFGRGSTHASADVRCGLLTREEGFELAREHDTAIPEALQFYLESTGMPESEFYHIMAGHRVEKLKGVELPLRKKLRKNRETIKPFMQQIIEEKRTEADADK